jgi:N-acetylneuraminate synthase/N,N'-diacetyllegionaminate synthase
MKVGDREVGPGRPPYLIAELGVNHDGSLEKALRLVEAARGAGADAIKLQWFEAEKLLSRRARLAAYQQRAGARDPFSMLRALELSGPQIERVVAAAHAAGLHAIVTIFSLEHVPVSLEIPFDAYKTASPDLVNRPLLEALSGIGRPLLVSTGAADLEEVAEALRWLGGRPCVLMQCVSAYPLPDESASLGGLRALARLGAQALGYSDHTTSLDTGALAVACGACVLEKHLTADRSAPGPDHACSLEPPGFRRYVELSRRAWDMVGPERKEVVPIEQDVRQASRQSLTMRRPLPAGSVIGPGDLTVKRPGTGMAPWRLCEVIGRRLSRAVEADAPLDEGDLL